MIVTKDTVLLLPESADETTVAALCRGLLGFEPVLGRSGKEDLASLGQAPGLTLSPGAEFCFSVTAEGAAVLGRDPGATLRGLFALLMQGQAQNGTWVMQEGERQSAYRAGLRFFHLCVFPESDRAFLKKTVRVAGLLQFTHVILEFWGTLPSRALKELAWQDVAWTREEVKELIAQIRAFGMEPVPMFNHLGHAAQARNRSGKHVVLDQAPWHRELFTPDGWVWNWENERVPGLLAEVRRDLYELFGPGSYFHIGFDEAYFVSQTPALRAKLPALLKQVTGQIASEGRIPMLWMDMLLPKDTYPGCTATGEPEELPGLWESIHPSSLASDWQYRVYEAPVPTSLLLKEKGFSTVTCSWLDRANVSACVNTVAEADLAGFMLTTWHTLEKEADGISQAALDLGAILFPWARRTTRFLLLATLYRAVSFEGSDYLHSGFAPQQFQPLPR